MAEDGQKTYSAKQVATRIGTDAKHLRKFFRDKTSGYTAVGQGGRYDFPESEIPAIRKAFDAWNSTKTRRNRQPSADRTPASAAGLIPRPRTETPRRSRDNKEGLHGNALDNDTLQERFAGIGARVQRHNLTVKQGRFVQQDPITPSGLSDTPKPQVLDFSEEEDRGPTDEEILGIMDELALEGDSDDIELIVDED